MIIIILCGTVFSYDCFVLTIALVSLSIISDVRDIDSTVSCVYIGLFVAVRFLAH